MRLLLIHLSDIHLKAASDEILKRAESIGNAVRSRNDKADLIACVCSGDIAFAGKPQQYDLAFQFFELISNAVGERVSFAVAPGNHDLDFEKDTAARESLVKMVLQTQPSCVDRSILELCLSPQEAFFAFRDQLSEAAPQPIGPRWCYSYCFKVNEDQVRVQCVNTAWMSQLQEKQGTLLVPSDFIAKREHDAFTITVFHHPYNWLSAASKPFIREAEALSDVILTGHEHEHDRSIKYRPEDFIATTYIEAAALQEHGDASNSAFNALLIDTTQGLYKFYHFTWDGTRYIAKDIISDWETLPLQSTKTGDYLDATPQFSDWLSDAGIPSTQAKGQRRTLSDVFVYPDLLESFRDPTLKRNRITIKSDNVYATVETHAVTFISGEPKSGRTSLAKKLYADFASARYTPLYLDGLDSAMRAGDSIPPLVSRQVKRQYGESALEAYLQLPRERRVILIDNTDRIKGKASSVTKLIDAFSKFAAHVIVLGDNTTGAITEVSAGAAANGDEVRSFQIQSFSYVLREKLAQRWFAEDDLDEGELSRRLERVTQILDIILGRNYVPAYPIYLIAVLQTVQDGSSIDPKASTHGYFYDLLIRKALAAHSETKAVSTRMAFLTHLAWEMYRAGRQDILESDLRASFDRYDETYAVGGLDYGKLVAELIDREMLLRDGDIMRFRYPYLYNYFVASYLSNNMPEQEVRTQIEDLTKNLGDDQSSDILMFLAHLSHDPFVIERLLATANDFFADREPETLETVLKVDDDDVSLEYVETSQSEARSKVAESKDSQVARHDHQHEEAQADPESNRMRLELTSALHAIRVMGQILKNFYGALKVDTKVDVTNASCDLGLRILNVALENIEAGHKQVVERVVEEIERTHPGLPKDKVRAYTERYLWVLTIVTTYGLLKVVSTALAAPELEPIYDRVFPKKMSVARKIINLNLRLDVSGAFPKGLISRVAEDVKGLHLPETLVKLAVLEHFDRIYVPPPVRQSVCTKLGIQYRVLPANRKYKA